MKKEKETKEYKTECIKTEKGKRTMAQLLSILGYETVIEALEVMVEDREYEED